MSIKILFCSSEIVPFAKTGGLADVSGALPIALEKLGCRLKAALPKYKQVYSHLSGGAGKAKLGRDIEVLFVENADYFERDGLYGDKQGDYPDNLERFAYFCSQILFSLKKTGFIPDIIHCNDWQTGLIPVYLQTILKKDSVFQRTKTVFTIHNLAYQGLFPREKFTRTRLDWELFNMHGLEFYGKVNLLKAGLVFSDFITTVSPTYAREIQTPEFGCGLDGVLRERKDNLLGIINGIDYSVWNPLSDNKIFHRYGKNNLQQKYLNKEKLQQELGLPCDRNVPLLGIIGRLADQKGIDLIVSALPKMSRLNLQFVLLGTGDAKYHGLLEEVKKQNYENVSVNLCFDAVMAHKIYAACDIFMMPSYYEPCGLGQLISFKYGTIPLVRRIGGLADTVCDYNTEEESGDGFVFGRYSSSEMLKALGRAISVYQDRPRWQRLVLKVMDYDYSWEASAKKYVELYHRLLKDSSHV